MNKIIEVLFEEVQIAYARPLELANGKRSSEVTSVLVRVRLETGETAWGENAPLAGDLRRKGKYLRNCYHIIRQSIMGLEVDDAERLLRELPLRKGPWEVAAATRMALFNLRKIREPHKYKKDWSVIVTVGRTTNLQIYDFISSLDTTEVKLKVGFNPMLDALAFQKLAIDFPNIFFRLDANRGWSLPQACNFLESIPLERVSAFEEPTENLHRDAGFLKNRFDIKLVADESVTDIASIHTLRIIGVDEISLKLQKTLSPSVLVNFAMAAQRQGLGVTIGNVLETSVSTRAALMLADTITSEFYPVTLELDSPWWIKNDPFSQVVILKKSSLRISNKGDV